MATILQNDINAEPVRLAAEALMDATLATMPPETPEEVIAMSLMMTALGAFISTKGAKQDALISIVANFNCNIIRALAEDASREQERGFSADLTRMVVGLGILSSLTAAQRQCFPHVMTSDKDVSRPLSGPKKEAS